MLRSQSRPRLLNDVADEKDEQRGVSLSPFVFAVLGVMTSRDDLDQ